MAHLKSEPTVSEEGAVPIPTKTTEAALEEPSKKALDALRSISEKSGFKVVLYAPHMPVFDIDITAKTMEAVRKPESKVVLCDPHPSMSDFTSVVDVQEAMLDSIMKTRDSSLASDYYGRMKKKLKELASIARELEHSETESVLDVLTSSSTIDSEDEIVFLKRLAGKRRALLQTVPRAKVGEFAELMPMRLENASNPSREIARLRDKRQILGIKDGKRDWEYPTFQLDPETLDIYPPLPNFYTAAHQQGYTTWEVLEWLYARQAASKVELVEKPSDINVDIANSSPVEYLEALLDDVEKSDSPSCLSPVDVLHAHDYEQFNVMAAAWLRGRVD